MLRYQKCGSQWDSVETQSPWEVIEHEGSDLISGSARRWIHHFTGYWEVVETLACATNCAITIPCQEGLALGVPKSPSLDMKTRMEKK